MGVKKIITIAAFAVVLAGPAFAQSAGEKTGVNSVLGIAPKTEDFIKEAAMSDMLEIESAKIAEQKGNADEKKFAAMMVTDHTKISAHKDAVSLFERYANGGDNPKLKDWAGRTLPALKHHLEMAQALDKNRK
jgi:putative membrane protein